MKFEGHQVNIPIKGIMRAGTDNLAADGAMNEVVGLEYKDGSWLPYKEFEEEWQVLISTSGNAPLYDIKKVYVHKTSDGQSHYIFIHGSTKTLYSETSRNAEQKKIYVGASLTSNVRDVSFVGNTLNIATDTGMEHYIWRSSSYEKTDESVLPEAAIRTELGFMYGDKYLAGVLHQNIQGNRTDNTKVRDIFVDVENGPIKDSEKTIIISSLMAAEGKVRDRGGISGYCLAVVGFRLRNGDVVCPHPPVLLGRTNAAHGSTIEGYREYCVESQSEYFTKSGGSTVKLYSKFEQDHEYPSGGYTAGIVGEASMHFLYKKKVLYDGWVDEDPGESTIELNCVDIVEPEPTGNKSTLPSVIANTIGTDYIARWAMVPDLNMTRIIYDYAPNVSTEIQKVQICDYVYAAGNGISLKIESLTEDQKENISSICVFITQDVSVFEKYSDEIDFNKNFYYQSGYVTNNPSGNYKHRVFKYVPARKKEEKIIKELKKLNTFYLVQEIQAREADDYVDWKLLDLSGRLGDNLVTQEQLPVTSFMQAENTPEHIDSYNMRLHMYDYKQKIFNGYSLPDFAHYGGFGQYDSVVHVGQVNATYKWEIDVEIEDESGRATVVNYTQSAVQSVISSLSPMLAYPDVHARKMTIRLYHVLSNMIWWEHVYPLSQWEELGMAVYIDPDLKPIDITADTRSSDFPSSIPITQTENNMRHYHNGLKVSDIAYPTYFPAAYTYRVGNEKIIGLATLTTPVSQDNFGSNQLIVFCTDGIYAMTVDTSGGGAYTSIPPLVSPEVCVNRNSICEIGGAIFFAADKGLMMLTGANQVQQYVPHLNGEPRFLPATTANKTAEGVYKTMIDNQQILSKSGDPFADSISHEDFVDFIKDERTHLVYISIKNKLLAYNTGYGTYNHPLYDFSYLIDIPTGNTTKLAMRSDCDDGEIISKGLWEKKASNYQVHTLEYLSQDGNGEISCLVQSRPIKVQQDDKCSYRVVLTGFFEGILDHWADLVVLGSLDGDHWRVIGVKEKKLLGGFHNIGCLTERGSWKYLMFIFGGKLNKDSHIDSVDITVDGRYNNKKR